MRAVCYQHVDPDILVHTSCPAADISTPESGSTLRVRVAVDDDICTVIVGAGSVAVSCALYNCKCCYWLSCWD